MSRELDRLVRELRDLKKPSPSPAPYLPKPRVIEVRNRKATAKQERFKKELMRTGDKVGAALEAYDTTDRGAASKLAETALAKPVIAEDVKEILERVGAGQEVAAECFAEALHSTTPEVITPNSISGGDPDHRTRIIAAKEVMKLHGAYPQTKIETHEHRHAHLTLIEELSTLPYETLTTMIKARTTPTESSPGEVGADDQGP